MSPKNKILVILLAAGLFLAGCASSSMDQPKQNDDNPPPGASETPGEETSVRDDLLPTQTPSPSLEHVEITPLAPVTGDVPTEILEEIFADLVEKINASKEDIQVIRSEAVVWNDGSLGCPKPGEFYIQMMINGYWVVLESKGVYYDYRASNAGNFKLCEGENLPPISPSEPGDQTNNTLVEQAKEDLAERLGIEIAEIELLKIEEVTWRNGSLGCPQTGMLYTQVLVNGSLIQLVHMDTVYQYHSGEGGAPFLCENPPKDLGEAITPGGESGSPPGLNDK